MQITLRAAELDESESLIALQRRASLANAGDRQILEKHPDIIGIPIEQFKTKAVTVAAWHDQIVGFSIVLQRDDGDAQLDGLFVDPPYWRQGIGRLLLKYALEHTPQSGATKLHVLANPHALAFYQSTGFLQTGIEQTEFGPGYLMQCPTRPSTSNPL